MAAYFSLPRRALAGIWTYCRSKRGHYLLAIVNVAAATWVRLQFGPVLGDFYLFGTFYIAVMISARYSGVGPSLVTLCLSVLFACYFLIPPRGTLAIVGLEHWFGLGLFLSVGATISTLTASQRKHERLAKIAAHEAIRRQQGLQQEIVRRCRVEESLSKTNQAYEKAMKELQASKEDLLEKNMELETFYDVAIDRELKLMALEKEAEKLRAELSSGSRR